MLAGVQAGYNFQNGPWVFGVEGDLQVTSTDDTFAPWKFSNPWFGTVRGRGGYAFLGSFSADSIARSTSTSPSDVTVHGWNVGPTVGLDWYITKRISVGVEGNAEFLFLERPAIPLKSGQSVPNGFQGLYAQSGSSVGAGFVGTAHLGVHF